MLTFAHFIFESMLDSAELKKGVTDRGLGGHHWELHHPEHGKIADIHLQSNHEDGKGKAIPIHRAKTMTMDIQTHFKHGLNSEIGSRTTAGPQYKLGVHKTRALMKQLVKHYPKLEKFTDSPRITGVSGKQGKKHQAEVKVRKETDPAESRREDERRAQRHRDIEAEHGRMFRRDLRGR